MVWPKLNELNAQKFSRKKLSKYCSTHFNIKVFTDPKHTDLYLASGILLMSQYVMIGYVNLRENTKVSEV